MAAFELATAGRILFGAGRAAEAPAEVAATVAAAGRAPGARVLVVTGRSRARAAALEAGLAARGLAAVPLQAAGEPTADDARAGAALAVAERCAAVVALGGGSALDLGKAVAGLATNGGEPLDFLEVVGRGAPLARPALPFVAIPTTAGTGSEVTRNAVLGVPASRVKASLRSPHLLPRLAVVDPDLLDGLPREVLAASGLDALAQVVEPYLSARANPLTDGLAREGILRSARSLRRAVLHGPGPAEREDLALASLLGGLCLANAGLGAVHGFAGPAGGMTDAPHGALCAALLVPALEVNLRALRARAPGAPALARLGEVARLLTGAPDAAAEDGIAWLRGLARDLGVRGLAALGLAAEDLPALAEKAKAASSMRGNPVALTDAELTELAERALDAP